MHIPWCIKKCPYCDFNSHQRQGALDEDQYVEHLLHDLQSDAALLSERKFSTIFIGGGTPSLFHGRAFAKLLAGVNDCVGIVPDAEITMEANPGTFEQQRFASFREAGINRLSIGIQSFQNEKLQRLGRVHDADAAKTALASAQGMGFDSINCDLMYGLPGQGVEDAVFDLETALALDPAHLSWYNLTIEPNTGFYRRPPELPAEDALFSIEDAGRDLLAQHGYRRYEVSAYSKPGQQCRHNLNYWQFGDYLGIGAGAHSKITDADGKVSRFWKHKTPSRYQNLDLAYTANNTVLSDRDKLFEFALNALRTVDGFSIDTFTKRTGLPESSLVCIAAEAEAKGLLERTADGYKATEHGLLFLNDLVNMFA